MPYYMKNPEVVLREEDQDGALLFNPDTNQIRALNETALYIWNLCDGSRDVVAIEEAIRGAFEDIPEDQVVDQIVEFMNQMVATEFVGIVED